MYKITLLDKNTVSFCTQSVSYFVEDLEAFEQNFLPECQETLAEQYKKSKNGYFASATGVGAEHDMVISDLGGEFLKKKAFCKKDFVFSLENGYNSITDYYAKELYFTVAKLQFQGEYYVVGKYRLNGVCACHVPEPEEETTYRSVIPYGNPIVTKGGREPEDSKLNPETTFSYQQTEKEFFEEDFVESFVWIILEEYESEGKIPEDWWSVSKKQMMNLMKDIPGECG